MFKRILYGGDYNPGQWPREIWDEDMRIFNLASINSATINVFSWAKLQPSENEYCFDELDDVIAMLTKEKYDIVLGTSTAALPAWLCKRYPEVTRVNYEGVKHKFGHRHNACPNSPIYLKYMSRLARKLAERYGKHPNVVCWHINNEYCGECYCENCEKAFRVWLKDKYKTLEVLNEAWNMEFWSHNIYDWDEIVAPNMLGDGAAGNRTAFAGISIDYCRFISDSMLNTFKMERDEIRAAGSVIPVTANLMGSYKGLDYFKWAKEMDIVSWDNYPGLHTPWSMTAMNHDLMRSLKNAPFMLMEQTPSQQNWQPYNSLKKLGQMRAQSYQSMAHGADTIQFFQLRRSKGACEKFHGAVIEHSGTENTRVFRETAQLGHELAALGSRLIGADYPADIGIIFDWDNYWALEYTIGPSKDLYYVDQIHKCYEYFYERNIAVDMLPVDADFSKYKAVIAPVLYMVKGGITEAFEKYAEAGGTLVTGFMSGVVNQSDNVHLGGYPGPLRKLCGIWAEEIDALAPGQTNKVRFADGTQAECRLLCDIIHSEGAETIAHYASGFYADSPCVTRNSYGKGTVFYIGTELDKAALGKVLATAVQVSGVKAVIQEATELEISRRCIGGKSYYFIINFRDRDLPLPACFAGKADILSGKTFDNVKPWDTLIICE